MKLNIIAFFTLILLTCNSFGMEKERSQEQIVHLVVNKSESLLCSVAHVLGMDASILNIWRITANKPEATHLLKMDGPKSFLQELPQELIAELQKFTRCCPPQSLEKIQSIPIEYRIRNVDFDSDDNLYFLDGKRNLQIWRKQDTHGKINYYQIYNLRNIGDYCLNSNAVITRFNDKSIKVYRILKKSDPEKPIVIEAAQLIPASKGLPYNLSDNSFFVVHNTNKIEVYKKDKGDPYYMRRKKIKCKVNEKTSVFKGPNESIIIIENTDGMVWLNKNDSSDKPSYRFWIQPPYESILPRGFRVIAVDELGRVYSHTPKSTIEIFRNTPLNSEKYEIKACLPYKDPVSADRKFSPIILSPSGALFISQRSKIKIQHQIDPETVPGFKALITETKKAAQRQEKIVRRQERKAALHEKEKSIEQAKKDLENGAAAEK